MKAFFLLFMLTFFSSNMWACETGELAFSQSDLCARVSWLQGPTFNQYNSLEVTFNEESALTLNVVPWMVMSEGHEHGSRAVKLTKSSATSYLVEKIYFMGGMMGEWYLRFQLVNSENVVVEEVRSLVELSK